VGTVEGRGRRRTRVGAGGGGAAVLTLLTRRSVTTMVGVEEAHGTPTRSDGLLRGVGREHRG
jgi:hypothetical protein